MYKISEMTTVCLICDDHRGLSNNNFSVFSPSQYKHFLGDLNFFMDTLDLNSMKYFLAPFDLILQNEQHKFVVTYKHVINLCDVNNRASVPDYSIAQERFNILAMQLHCMTS